jgi:hypothetical protein
MNALFKHISSDRILFWCFSISIGCVALGTLLLGLTIGKLPTILPLYNQLPWGDARLGGKMELFIPLALATLIAFGNAYLSKQFYSNLPLVARILAATTMITSLLVLAFVARTVQLII